MRFKLRDSKEKNAAMQVMIENEQYQNDPYVGIFWYDTEENELFGVKSTLAQEARWYTSPQFRTTVRTETRLHKQIWEKEYFKRKDKRFQGDYTKIPRGRVFEFKNNGFKVFTGNWIKNYPECKNLILFEFQLPDNTEFIIDEHWDIGHGWSDEF